MTYENPKAFFIALFQAGILNPKLELIIIDEKTSYKELILDVTQDSLILQSIDDNILGTPETFIRSY